MRTLTLDGIVPGMVRLREIAVWLFVSALCAATPLPTFNDFHTSEIFKGKVAKPLLRTPVQKRFETQILRQSSLPANFAGHYKIVEWGCGSSCVSFAIVDFKKGNVYDGPFLTLGYGQAYRYEGGYNELEYYPSSSLLIARGCADDKNCGTYYYAWQGDHFDQLRFVPHGPPL